MTEQPPPRPTLGDKLALVAMIMAAVILILVGFVLIAAVVKDELNATAIVTVLGGMFTTLTGLVLTNLIRSNGKEDK